MTKSTIDFQVYPHRVKPTFQDFGDYVYVYVKFSEETKDTIPSIYILAVDRLYELYHL